MKLLFQIILYLLITGITYQVSQAIFGGRPIYRSVETKPRKAFRIPIPPKTAPGKIHKVQKEKKPEVPVLSFPNSLGD